MDFATIPIRLARPSRDLEAARRFWVDGLGLDVLWQTGPDGEGGTPCSWWDPAAPRGTSNS
jgi:catechol 2,3-dioxygenase-like lactoylglutathione lyase family enzyme